MQKVLSVFSSNILDTFAVQTDNMRMSDKDIALSESGQHQVADYQISFPLVGNTTSVAVRNTGTSLSARHVQLSISNHPDSHFKTPPTSGREQFCNTEKADKALLD